MKIALQPLFVAAGASALAALPVGLGVDGMRVSAVSVGLVLGAALASSAWLWILAASGLVTRLSVVTGALLALLSFATVVVVFFALPAPSAPRYNFADRAFLVSMAFAGLGLYPLVVGGLLGLILRRMPLRHAP